MSAFRWILLLAGAALVIGIYLWGRRRPTASEQPPATLSERAERSVPQLDDALVVRTRVPDMPPVIRADPSFDSEELPSISATDYSPEPVIESIGSSVDEPSATTFEVSTPFRSDEADSAFKATSHQSANDTDQRKPPAKRKIVSLRLSAGENRVDGTHLKSWFEEAGLRHGKFEIFHRMHDEHAQLFSVASMVEPGTFDPYAMAGVQFPGVMLFLQLPGPIDGVEMVSQMVACGRELERKMGGILQDERGLPLTEARAHRLRDDAANFLHLLGQS